VSWSGQDDAGGSGIASYDIFVSNNNGPYTLWRDDTTDTSGTFTGQVGHTYRFYAVAVDNVGHVESAPLAPDTQTTVVSSLNQSPSLLDAVFSLAENSIANTAVGTVTATDPDIGDTFTYSIAAGNGSGAFAINSTTGAITVANSTILDFETTPMFTLTIQVADDEGAVDTATVSIQLTDVNEAATLSLNGPAVTWIKKQPAVKVLPVLTVSNGNLSGGTLTIRMNVVGTKRALLDSLNTPSISSIGTESSRAVIDGRLTIQIQLSQNATSNAVQSFLRGITFITKGKGLKTLTRSLEATLSAAGSPASTISQVINVRKKA
jgi:hypothetical protein